MGVYLNSRKPHDNYRKTVDSTYFVDKSMLLNELPRNCKSYQQYIDRIQDRLIKDLKKAYPEAEIGIISFTEIL